MKESMKAVLPFHKRRGETPKEALERLVDERPELKGETLSYAGRLDPLAEGLLLVLVGDANKEREKYLSLTKKYIFEVLFGWSTDTYDIAGILEKTSDKRVDTLMLMEGVAQFEGEHVKEYPPFSSKPVGGKPLFWWAKEGRLSEITIPTRKVEITSAQLLKKKTISGDELYNLVHKSIGSLTGDFRQDRILSCWEANMRNTYNKEYDVAVIEVECGSGTYMRSLASELGEYVGVPALALKITRTEVGEYCLSDT